MYKLNQIEDFVYLTFPILDEYDDLVHCFTTRKGGVSKGPYESLNIGYDTGDDEENVRKNNLILFNKLSIDIKDIVETDQTHTNNIKYVDESYKGRAMKDPVY